MKRTIAVVVVILLIEAAGAGLFIQSGFYNIGADEHHAKLTLAIIERMRERSIAARDRSAAAQPAVGADAVRAGAARYAALCVGCHLAPGVMQSDLRPGLYPHPPNLAQEDVENPQRAFWIIKHGIKMTAMPAWGRTLDDAAIWDLVAFVQAMPNLTPETYQQISR
jgi:mono/diheme cytochrome c family protein